VDLIESTGNISVVGAELAVSVMLSSLVRRGVCPNFIATRGVFSCPFQPPQHHWGSADNKRPKGNSYCSPRPRKPKEPNRSKRGRYQYIRMELCDAGDAEEFLKEQKEETVPPNEARMFLFQISFALHAAAVKCSLKHYDVKLLNIFLRRVQSEKPGDVVLRYGLGGHMFALRSPRERAIVAKLADYGTANIDSGSNGKQVSIAQFTTLENTPLDFLMLGDGACQGHGHDSFGLGLCMLHLFTGHAPYEEILSDVSCPPNLKKRLCQIWECEDEAQYSVVRSVILADVYKDEEGHILEGEPDDTLYNTLYKFLVLFGIPKVPPALESCKVWVAVRETLETGGDKGAIGKGAKKAKAGDITRYRKDCRKYSLSHGSNRYIARARESLEVSRWKHVKYVLCCMILDDYSDTLLKAMEGGMEILLKLVCFDPQERATALDVLNSSFMIPLREASGQVSHDENDEVLSYTAFSTQN
jgi:serine/threonine protein kinase